MPKPANFHDPTLLIEWDGKRYIAAKSALVVLIDGVIQETEPYQIDEANQGLDFKLSEMKTSRITTPYSSFYFGHTHYDAIPYMLKNEKLVPYRE